jgi:tetratricopeptide (TPR) repeat protein
MSYIYNTGGLGLALDNLGNHLEAIKYYDKALAINLHNVLALNNKGVASEKLSGAAAQYDGKWPY